MSHIDRMRDLMRQASFHQLYGEVSAPKNIKMYKNTEVNTEEAKKKLKLYFDIDGKMREDERKFHDQFREWSNSIAMKMTEMRDMKFRKWLYTVVLSDFGYDFIGCKMESVEPNHIRLTNVLSDDSLDLYVERTEVENLTNQWMELQWELHQKGEKIKEGRDFLNMEIKLVHN
ncbi:hypothetical protein BigBertha_84 [Bacillus phage BigBertha]|uniref:Uncharacterized protein n=1 Tax=Bacillus phage BigBertha TaxID=1406781 RepID=U5PVJ0_9CAUD|nr:hypothetical protein BigBertha_84 [Bacillus phage BigBertha]YP_009289963.1 hypothetical protein BI003_gp084 [Bacillus phage Phrodo]UGO48896.1 hypothetical protein JARJAR_82 [Bacillus phage vB_BanH_JarJar]UGO50387.1 hypothetical protein RONSWANSON_81 [Bacillus phage vB_BanH_RonSwanson]AGY46592.1 hypothetical protein BigBertha_84 [Bacillus phage BigBertha]AMW62125.1 hypothetical protein PHRODO_84 [Bacillus phage Phrodo]